MLLKALQIERLKSVLKIGVQYNGKTPMQTFRDTIHLAKEKMIGYNLGKEI
ncbi:hypothetical protein TAGGR_310 [Thermodesulfovibrio aggregans]|uniref:Uncharacterized protein n=2 Tax=Thermodesulfovibrio aggregans TaxID=86166 RepID=A0A0U9HTH5_9BACT|nr:hypothetical protein TAGGR_310 [Thermodesulfovibrio aggregans]